MLNLGGGAIKDFLPNFFLFVCFCIFSPVLFTEHALLLYWENLIQKIVGLGVGIENTDKNEFERLSKGTIQLCSSYSWLAHRELRSSYI